MAGKRGSRRHSTTSFSENVEVAETSYQMLEVLSFCHQERVQPPSLKVTVLTFLVKNGKMKLSGESIFLEYAKKLKSQISYSLSSLNLKVSIVISWLDVVKKGQP